MEQILLMLMMLGWLTLLLLRISTLIRTEIEQLKHTGLVLTIFSFLTQKHRDLSSYNNKIIENTINSTSLKQIYNNNYTNVHNKGKKDNFLPWNLFWALYNNCTKKTTKG